MTFKSDVITSKDLGENFEYDDYTFITYLHMQFARKQQKMMGKVQHTIHNGKILYLIIDNTIPRVVPENSFAEVSKILVTLSISQEVYIYCMTTSMTGQHIPVSTEN